MQTASDLLEAIGNTSLIRLKRASEETGCEILGKAEFANPGQSVKDRAALYLIRDASPKEPSSVAAPWLRELPATLALVSPWSETFWA